MAEYLIIFLAFLIVIPAVCLFFLTEVKLEYKTAKVGINGKIFEAEIADTILKKAKGLSGRKALGENKGMIFIFTNPGKYNFWMIGMNFPLDIIWISGNKIVDISKNVQPSKSGRLTVIVSPLTKADKVLEIPAGSAEKFDIKIGDEAVIN
ncbi:MAG: DUF192 domain-containing protein [bacterium]|nr:DUF192 domain-containing protein [bacterium]